MRACYYTFCEGYARALGLEICAYVVKENDFIICTFYLLPFVIVIDNIHDIKAVDIATIVTVDVSTLERDSWE